MRYFLLVIVLLLSEVSPAVAATYWNDSGSSKATLPGAACYRRSFDVWTRKRYQSFQIKLYPRRLILPCRRYFPNAEIRGWFESFKISGGRNEACYGQFTQRFSNWGQDLKISFSHKGTLRGMVCRDIGRTQTIAFRRSR